MDTKQLQLWQSSFGAEYAGRPGNAISAENVRRLMREVGFQQIHTFGDFESDFDDADPDFLVHIAEKKYEDG